MSWEFILKRDVYRNKHTGKTYVLEGYDMIPDGMTTHQVGIFIDEEGKKQRIEQRYIDAHFDMVGKE